MNLTILKNKRKIIFRKILISIILYADDIILLAKTVIEMNKMLKIIEEVGKKLEIKFYLTKTIFLMFGS